MLGRILCALGLHNLGPIKLVALTLFSSVEARGCARCKRWKVQ